jgi:hypothetical protein
MGRHESTGFRGYLVRVQTKQGRIYRHRNLRLVLDKSKLQGLSLQTHRLADRATINGDEIERVTSYDVGNHDSLTEGLPVVAWRSYAAKDGGKKAMGGRSLGRYPVIEETTLDEFVQLAHTNTKLPGEATDVRSVQTANVEDDEQVAKLYSLGILYDGPELGPANTQTETVIETGESAFANAADTSAPTPDTASPYQADSLETIRHAEPLYTVRHVVAKKKGKRVVGHSAAKSPLTTTTTMTKDAKRPEENVVKDETKTSDDEYDDSVPTLFALNGVWEDGEGQTIDGRALWSDLEEFEYVVLADDDLASLAGSWVELESVLGTDDGE